MESVETFGFRGEALSSLCALADVKIITSTENDSSTATELVLDANGNITSQDVCSGNKGTHILVSSLFHTLPVRRKDFIDNSKREFTKVVNLLQAYAIIQPGIKISVSNTIGVNNKKSVLISTSGKGTIKTNIANIYGVQSLGTLMTLDLSFDHPSHIPNSEPIKELRIDGFISKPIFGQGRPASDRQIYFINSRPCILPQISKAFNEIYRSFNTTQLPVVIANIKLDTALYDVNVTPDKRTILLHNEQELIEMIKEELVALFEKTSHSIPQNNTTSKLTWSSLEWASKKSIPQRSDTVEEFTTEPTKDSTKLKPADAIVPTSLEDASLVQVSIETGPAEISKDSQIASDVSDSIVSSVGAISSDGFENLHRLPQESKRSQNVEVVCRKDIEGRPTNKKPRIEAQVAPEATTTALQSTARQMTLKPATPVKEPELQMSNKTRTKTGNYDLAVTVLPNRVSIGMRDLQSIGKYSSTQTVKLVPKAKRNKKPLANIKLSNIDGNEEEVEDKLNLSINKNDFSEMNIVGQFNKGFILVTNTSKKNDHKDLFIVDQHASDEIYNFEQLQKDTVIQNQPLMSPLVLELTAIEELLIMNNLNIFESNGFKIIIDESASPGQKCKLTSLPISKSTTFGIDDVQELIYLIHSHPGQTDLKCSKLRAMFASRACRKSIMVGDSLTPKIMSKVVNHLSTLDRPWNCPHGRPTIRHLANIGQFSGSFQDYIDIEK